MGRLSVSLDDEQEAWITSTSQELGISKGKVLRECIDAVRTGESLFTEQVNTGESPDADRISSLEQRFAALEEMVRNEIGSAGDDDTASVASQSHSTSDGPDSTAGTVPDADQSVPPESPSTQSAEDSPDDQQTTAQSSGAPPHNASPEHDGPSGESSTPTDSTGPRTGPKMPDSAAGGSPDSTPQSDPEAFVPPDLDSADADAIRSALESSLASEARATSVLACWQEVQDRGTVHVQALKSHFEEHPLEYDTADTWWAEEIEPVLETLPGIDPPPGTGSFYRFKY